MKTCVIKFGGAAMESPSSIADVAEVIRERKGPLVVVVSAMGGMTDKLMGLAHEVAKEPSKRELDMLLSVGERVSMSLLAMALKEKGVEAISLTGSQSGIITCTHHGEAFIKDVRPIRIEKHLQEGKVVIVGGFQGVSEEKEITTLGRGGSDTTAVALGVALGTEVIEYYKDVKGIYTDDPKKNRSATLLDELSFEKALSYSPFVLHKRAILLASKNGIPLHVKSFKRDERGSFPGTWIRGRSLRNECVYESRDRYD